MFPFVWQTHSRITNNMFSIIVNGDLGGYFSSRRGIYQEVLISPYLFVMIIDILSEMIHKIKDLPDFKLHKSMEKLGLNHISVLLMIFLYYAMVMRNQSYFL